MNTSNTNTTGFAHSYMLSHNFPILLAQLPDALVNSMPELYYPRLFNPDGITDYDYVTHKLFMESAVEMGIVAADAEGYVDEVDSNSLHAQFPYYVSNNSRIKHEYNGTGVANNYWTATPYLLSTADFWLVISNGAGNSHNADNLLQRWLRLLPRRKLICFNLLRNLQGASPCIRSNLCRV